MPMPLTAGTIGTSASVHTSRSVIDAWIGATGRVAWVIGCTAAGSTPDDYATRNGPRHLTTSLRASRIPPRRFGRFGASWPAERRNALGPQGFSLHHQQRIHRSGGGDGRALIGLRADAQIAGALTTGFLAAAGVSLLAFDVGRDSCVRSFADSDRGVSANAYENIIANCDPAGAGETGPDGTGLVGLATGQFVVIGQSDSDGDGSLDVVGGAVTGQVRCGAWTKKHLRMGEDRRGE